MWCSHFKTLHQCRSFMTALQNFFFTATSLIFNLFLMTNNIISTSDRQPCYYFVKKNCRISRHEFLAYFLSRVYITNTYTYISSIYMLYIPIYTTITLKCVWVVEHSAGLQNLMAIAWHWTFIVKKFKRLTKCFLNNAIFGFHETC